MERYLDRIIAYLIVNVSVSFFFFLISSHQIFILYLHRLFLYLSLWGSIVTLSLDLGFWFYQIFFIWHTWKFLSYRRLWRCIWMGLIFFLVSYLEIWFSGFSSEPSRLLW